MIIMVIIIYLIIVQGGIAEIAESGLKLSFAGFQSNIFCHTNSFQTFQNTEIPL